MSAKRPDAGAASAGLFTKPSLTGGLAAVPDPAPIQTTDTQETVTVAVAEPIEEPDTQAVVEKRKPRQTRTVKVSRTQEPDIVRVGIDINTDESFYLRNLSRPSRTGAERTLGTKFVASGVLRAAIDLLQDASLDMRGIDSESEQELVLRARKALIAGAKIADAK